MRFIIFLTLVVAENFLYVSSEYSDEWSQFKRQYNKKYRDHDDEFNHYKVYLENKKRIRRHNNAYLMGSAIFKQNTNQFSDMTHEDFLTNMTRRVPWNDSPGIEYTLKNRETLHAEKSINWKNSGYVTHVKDQGYGGRPGWAFAVTGVLEGQYFKNTGKLVPLSEQNIIDCAPVDYYGSGYNSEAFKYIMYNGINSEESYPYNKKKDLCKHSPNKNILKVKEIYKLPSGDEMTLLNVSFTFGPILVGIDASPDTFMHYSEGIYREYSCRKNNLNHNVLLVGYGSEGDFDYWIVKNSWGTSWGENGYMRIVRNRFNMCGIATDAWVATVTPSNASSSQCCNDGLIFCCNKLCIIVAICLPYIINSNIIY